ncbi:hypothetical protein MKX83_24255 [Cytobacillus sp. FSL M8-0252]|uniref:hypothetical protein n=1 Tax=Cytobacillus sp. FSL M8-0252 TaxID=2921621 RepID=UPI0030F5F3D2
MKYLKTLSFLLILFITSFIFDTKIVHGETPYDVPSSVKNGWNDNLGLKNFPATTGKRLVYDVYSKKYTSNGYKIVNKNFGDGTRKYVNFQGWSVIQGHKRHTTTNHETYIVARKVIGLSGVGQTKIYKALPRGNLSATEDLEYNNQGAGVWNECPANATNRDNELHCNMRYDNVGFDVFLPLDELFANEDESASWTLFIVKKVGSHIVYSPLNIPFEFSDTKFQKGEVSLSSGINARSLQMNGTNVLRRSYPRQIPAEVREELGDDRYFQTGKYYTQNDSDESTTAVWYGVRSSEDRNAKKWANTAYWTFGGEQALLSYRTDYIPPPTASCPKPVKPKPRYSYELDFEVTRIDGKTVNKNSNTVTEVDVKRKSYASDRNEAKLDVQSDINTRNTKITNYKNELTTLKSQESKIKKDLEEAEKTNNYDRINKLMKDLQSKRQEIVNKECQINTLQEEIDHYKKELNDLKEVETGNTTMTTPVIVKFNNSQKGTQNVTLRENETKTLVYTWKLTDAGTVLADINPERKAVSGVTEETYSNNTRSTPIHVASQYTPNACAKPNETSYAEGIIRTENSTGEGQKVFKEKVYTTIAIPEEHKNRRAGFGFEYTISTRYVNEDSETNSESPNNAKSYMPTLIEHLPYKDSTWNSPTNKLKISGFEVPLQNTKTTGNSKDQKKEWKVPVYFVEEFSGNVFLTENHSERNYHDNLLDGGRKWFLPFEQPDGIYEFTTLIENAGVNNLNTCVIGEVEVNGSIIGDPNGNDDFIKRSVTPNNPFPSGIGWNWNGQESHITNLNNWYNEWYQYPNQIPFSQYEKTYFLTTETIEQIKKYNEKENYEYELGKSIFDSISIPSKE